MAGALLQAMRRTTEAFRAEAPAVAELAAGAVVVDASTREVLLLHHRDEDRWCFPKGHVEAGESIRAAALREVREETGLLHVVIGEEVAESTYRFYDPARRLSVVKTSIYFLGLTTVREVRLEPLFDRHAWVASAAARVRLAYPADQGVLDAALLELARRT